MPTTVEVLLEQIDKCRGLASQYRNEVPGAGREFSLAATELENAVMRFNRGMALTTGNYRTADLEKLRQ